MSKLIRSIRIEGNIAYVHLTQGYEAVIDAADADFVGQWGWYALVSRNTVYAVRKDLSGDKPRTVYLHRAIMGDPENLQVDHEDGSGLNNRRLNLRKATCAQNSQNQRTRADNTSGFKGVSWHKSCQKWQAYINLNGQKKHLGLFATAELAYSAYCRASAEYHGEYGRTT